VLYDVLCGRTALFELGNAATVRWLLVTGRPLLKSAGRSLDGRLVGQSKVCN